MKDTFGRELVIGDSVIYSSEKRGICVGRVVKLYSKDRRDRKIESAMINVIAGSSYRFLHGNGKWNCETKNIDFALYLGCNVIIRKSASIIICNEIDVDEFHKFCIDRQKEIHRIKTST